MFNNKGRFDYEYSDDMTNPSYIYYNCDIINNRTDETSATGVVAPDPQVRFNETRDTALVKDASKYEFSIVRFTMNGPNLDIPLFIPSIAVGASNPTADINLSTYSVAISFVQTWNYNESTVFNFNITPASRFLVYVPEINNSTLAPLPNPPITQQDISTRYYWVQTYQHWVNLVNDTLLLAHQDTYNAFSTAWYMNDVPVGSFPFATFASFQAYCQTPQIEFDPQTGYFTIYADSDGYGQRLTEFQSSNSGPASPPQERLFFNSNMYGLFSNFNNYYWNPTVGGGIPQVTIQQVVYKNLTNLNFGTGVPAGYVYEVIFANKFYQNVSDYRIAPYTSPNPPLGYVPPQLAKVYWTLTQDYKSTDSLWSPVSSIVFTTTLLPIKSEASSQPNVLGTSTTGDSRATSASAFTPIITDIAIDTSQGGSAEYRQFIYYAPQAEYRMSALTTSPQEIRNINVAVYWKNRLNSQLYPVNMYNLSNVSLKMMFRHKRIKRKSNFSELGM